MNYFLKGLGIFVLVVLAFFALGFLTMHLWNWLMPYLFHLPTIDFYMAIGLVVLSKILLGGIRFKGDGSGWGKRQLWKAKWESMSEEDRDKFKQQFAERCKHRWGKVEINIEKH